MMSRTKQGGTKYLKAGDILDKEPSRQGIDLFEFGQYLLHKIEKGFSARVSSALCIWIENRIRLTCWRKKPEIRVVGGELLCREPRDVDLRAKQYTGIRANMYTPQKSQEIWKPFV